jgi:hypothetical protein
MNEKSITEVIALLTALNIRKFASKKELQDFSKEISNKIDILSENVDILSSEPDTSSEIDLISSALEGKISSLQDYIDEIKQSIESDKKDDLQAALDLLDETKKLADKLSLISVKDGRDGIDGINGIDGKNGVDGKDGKDASDLTAQDIADKLNKEKGIIQASTIKGMDKLVEYVSQLPTDNKGNYTNSSGATALTEMTDVRVKGATNGQVLGYNATTQKWEPTTGGGSSNTFETVSKNLPSSGATFNYTSGVLTSIVYSSGITKTLNYTSGALTSIVLSGSTPSGISLTKTLAYTSGTLSTITYS